MRDVKIMVDEKSKQTYVELSNGKRFTLYEDSGLLRLSCTDKLEIKPIASNAINVGIVTK